MMLASPWVGGIAEFVPTEVELRREGLGSCSSFHDKGDDGFGMRHPPRRRLRRFPRALLKPPISDVWSKGERAAGETSKRIENRNVMD